MHLLKGAAELAVCTSSASIKPATRFLPVLTSRAVRLPRISLEVTLLATGLDLRQTGCVHTTLTF
jgi:hypothetical protein